MNTLTKPLTELAPGEKRALLMRMLQAEAAPRLCPCSFAQERLWLLDQLAPGNIAYNVPVAVRMTGPLRVAAFAQSLNAIVERHEALRTTFTLAEGRPMQVIAPVEAYNNTPLQAIDLRDLPPEEREAEIRRRAIQEAQQPFDLGRGPLLRVALLRAGEEEHVLLLTMHHIVCDAWSLDIFVRELAALYSAHINTPSTQQSAPLSALLSALPFQYADFAHWQREWLHGARTGERSPLQAQLDYWREQLAGELAPLELPADHPRPPVQTVRGAGHSFTLSPALTVGVKQICRQANATLFMGLLAAFQTLLHRYSGQHDIRVGTPIANRNRVELESLIGFFVNTLVLRADCSGNPRFHALLGQVRERALGAYAHQDLPFEKLVEGHGLERDLSRAPIFQAMFMLQNAPRPPLELADLRLQPLEIDSGTAKFDLTLVMVDTEDGLAGEFVYNADLFDPPTIERMAGHFQILLAGIVADPDRRIGELPLLTEPERHQLLSAFNATQREYPRAACMHELFEAQARRTPDAIAVAGASSRSASPDERLTYQVLNQRANQLAHYLRELGVGPDVLVGVSIERSVELLVGLLGILKAGGAYVPLDPTYPADRLRYMLQDAQVRVVLTARRGEGQRGRGAEGETVRALLFSSSSPLPLSRSVIDLIADRDQIARQPETNLESEAVAENLAYVIYTSGSTGKPKGSAITHRGLVNYLTWCTDAYVVGAGIGAPVHSSISFDLTITGLFAPLLAGTAVHLLPEAPGVEALSAALRQNADFSLVKITPVHLELLSRRLTPPQAAGRARALIIGGEALLAEQIAFWQDAAPETILVNEYGPTETVVGCCVYTVPPGKHATGPIPIGRPIANTQLYILDAYLQPVPAGVPGELYIGGDGLARGYLNRPDLTAERFVPNPFATTDNRPFDFAQGRRPTTDDGAKTQNSKLKTQNFRLYRTGDLARHLPDGTIEYLGRIDHQVKIRGYRIELGEIEAVLRGHGAVREAAVVVHEPAPGDKRLIAYVAPVTEDRGWKIEDGQAGADALPSSILHPPSSIPGELRVFLQERLPDYMVPSAFVVLNALPSTSNGKVDRRALPSPEQHRPASATTYVAPHNQLERGIAGIWQAVLRIDQVGAQDNFFDLGGSSLLLVQVQGRLRALLDREVALVELFQYPTIAALAQALQHNDPTRPSFGHTYTRAEARRDALRRRGRKDERAQPREDDDE